MVSSQAGVAFHPPSRCNLGGLAILRAFRSIILIFQVLSETHNTYSRPEEIPPHYAISLLPFIDNETTGRLLLQATMGKIRRFLSRKPSAHLPLLCRLLISLCWSYRQAATRCHLKSTTVKPKCEAARSAL